MATSIISSAWFINSPPIVGTSCRTAAANLRQSPASRVVTAMYTTIWRRSSIRPSCSNCASNGTSRRNTGQLARYAAIIAS